MNVLDLFSGTGELGRALHEGLKEALGIEARTVAYCEQDRFCQALLMSRMWRGEIDHAPICTDVRELRASDFFLGVDIIVGGWPCQGNSVAGLRKGMEDERSGLVKEVIRLAREFRPGLIYLENVAGVLTAPGDGVGFVAGELAALGYDVRYTLLSAAEVGATHQRNRFWLVAYAAGRGLGERGDAQEGGWIAGHGQFGQRGEGLGDAERVGPVRLEGRSESRGGQAFHSKSSTWQTPMGRDYRSSGTAESFMKRSQGNHQTGLNEQVSHLGPRHQETAQPGSASSEPTPKLNPRFVEWLLGSPIGMTELEPWATEWILSARRKRLKS